MNVLYITPTDPRDVSSGGEQRSHFLWKALQRCGSVYCFVTVPGGRSLGEDSEVDRIHFEHVCRPNFFQKRIAFVWRKLKFGQTYVCNERKALRAFNWLDVKFDCVVVRYLGWAWTWGAWRFGRCFVDIDDLPMHVFDSQLAQRIPFWMRSISRVFYRNWQRRALRRAVCGWVPNADDVNEASPYVKARHLRNLARNPQPGYRIDGAQEKLLLTVGSMGYGPNSEGVDWFLKEVWPAFHVQYPEWSYAIAGGGVTNECRERWTSVAGVRVLGFVDDIDAWYEKAYVVIAPILSGAGTCIKVMESCLHGRKTLLTPCASRGYLADSDAGLGLSIFENAKGFVLEMNKWMALSEFDRLRSQNSIKESAEKINSFDEFAEVVSNSLKEGGGEPC